MGIALLAEPGRRLAAVTGASRGLGLELAKVFARNDFDLVIAADATGLRDVVPQLEALGARVDAVQTDLATASGVDRFYECLVEQGRDIDAVAMSAGAGVGGEFLDTSLEEELRLVNLSIISVLRLTKKILPDFVKQGFGRILYSSSLPAPLPGPYCAVYAASKCFVQSFAEAIRAEVQDAGVTVTALHPGTGPFERARLAAPADPETLAREGFEALMAGKDHLSACSFRLVPLVTGQDFQGSLARTGSGRSKKGERTS